MTEPRAERLRGRAGVAQRARRLAAEPLCRDCLAETPPRITAATRWDHITPLAHGGDDTDENGRALCEPHHLIRTAEQFGHKRRLPIGDDGWPTG